jgi:hypothetical protein
LFADQLNLDYDGYIAVQTRRRRHCRAPVVVP